MNTASYSLYDLEVDLYAKQLAYDFETNKKPDFMSRVLCYLFMSVSSRNAQEVSPRVGRGRA